MIKNRQLFLSTLLMALVIFTGEAIAGPECVRVDVMVGSITVMRAGKLEKIDAHDTIRNGDIIKIEERGFVELSAEESTIKMRITGPKIFRLNVADLKKNSRSGETLFRLYDKITKDTGTYYPRTVVTAIRGVPRNREEAAREGKKKIEEVIKLIKEKNFDDASAILDDLESSRRMKRLMGEIISFYQAEILFQKMEFDKALVIFKELYDGSIPDYHYREMSLARALLCAELTGQSKIKEELMEEYRKRYGREGEYRSLIFEIR